MQVRRKISLHESQEKTTIRFLLSAVFLKVCFVFVSILAFSYYTVSKRDWTGKRFFLLFCETKGVASCAQAFEGKVKETVERFIWPKTTSAYYVRTRSN